MLPLSPRQQIRLKAERRPVPSLIHLKGAHFFAPLRAPKPLLSLPSTPTFLIL